MKIHSPRGRKLPIPAILTGLIGPQSSAVVRSRFSCAYNRCNGFSLQIRDVNFDEVVFQQSLQVLVDGWSLNEYRKHTP